MEIKKILSFILLTVILICCDSDKNTKCLSNKSEVKVKSEKLPVNITKIDYPVDSLLKFDSESELREIYGKHVKRSTIMGPEGMGEFVITLLFPNTKNEIEFHWANEKDQLQQIVFYRPDTDWKTQEGITIGMGIKELERLNNKAFSFSGLGWDYGGMINWDNGKLEKRGIHGTLIFPKNILPNKFSKLEGDDKEFNSTNKLALEANLVLYEVRLNK